MVNEQKLHKWLVAQVLKCKRTVVDLVAAGRESTDVEGLAHQRYERVQSVIDAVPAFVAYVDAEQRYGFANRPYAELHGKSPQEVYGLHVRDVIGEETYAQARSNIEAALNGRPVQFEMPFGTDAQGRERHVYASYVPDAGEDGAVRGFVALVMDVSERKRAELALAASERRWRTVFESACVAMAIVDAEGSFLETNPALRAFLGASDAQLRTTRVADVTYEPYRARSSRLFDQLVQGQRNECRVEQRYVRRDQRVVWGDTAVSAVRNANGAFQYAVPMVMDTTAQKKAEEALRKSEMAYRDLVTHATFGIYRSSRDGKLLSANPALAEMLGYGSVDELLAVNMGRDVYADPKERETLVAEYEARDVIRDAEVAWKRKGGRRITVRLNGRTIRNERGEVEGFEVIVEDVTERRRLEAQLRQAQKMEAVGRLAGGVAHDFNNILTAILGVTDILLLDLAPDDDALRADLMEIRDSANRAAALTRQLLAFSRQQVLVPQRLDLNVLVTNAERLLRRVIGEDIHIETALDPALGTVEADPGQLEQVLLNLAVNARDAMPNGGTLTISTQNIELDATYGEEHLQVKPGPYVMLAVADTGVGMDRDTQAHVFEPFFTTKEAGKGTGLGLATVYGIVKQSGGYIWVYSEPGRGTTFKIYLPRVEGEAEQSSESDQAVRGGTEVILLVEDEDAVRRLAQRVLAEKGYTVLGASNGEEALAIFRQREADIELVVTDVIMPNMGGQQLYEVLRNEGKTVKFLFMSGYSERDRHERRTLERESPFLQKPWTVEALLGKVREALERP